MKLASRYEPLKKYVNSLIQEIELVASYLPTRMKISHLHWGGGTPTALHHEDLSKVMEIIHKHFDLLTTSEIAIESDPRTLTKDMIEQLGKEGFNRASFGVQEFDATVQKAINRIQPEEMVRECIADFRSNHIESINFDLIYGLPHQTLEMVKKTIDISIDCQPSRIALFGYAHVPWVAKKQRLIDKEALPGIEARYEMADVAAKMLVEAGYQAIGFDHFALPNDSLAIAARSKKLRRNFQGFTNDAANTLIGIGASSIGRTEAGYIQNFTETGAWARSIDDGVLPVSKGIALSTSDKMRAEIIETLICNEAVDMDSIMTAHGFRDNWKHYFELDDYIADNLILVENGVLTVMPKGKKIIRVIASAFDAYYGTNEQKHSVAV